MVGEGLAHRAEHVWFKVHCGTWAGGYKCCICGGITMVLPPFPTPDEWVPQEFELPLTAEERRLCPNPNTGTAT